MAWRVRLRISGTKPDAPDFTVKGDVRQAPLTFMENGAYLMFRRLAQLVPEFDLAIKAEAAKTGGASDASLTPESPHAMVVITPKHGVVLQWRTAVGQTLQTNFGPPQVTTPQWVRVDRTGDTFTGFFSSDGQTWQQIGTPHQIALGPDDLVGLAVTAHDGSLNDPLPLNTSVFDNLTITPAA